MAVFLAVNNTKILHKQKKLIQNLINSIITIQTFFCGFNQKFSEHVKQYNIILIRFNKFYNTNIDCVI